VAKFYSALTSPLMQFMQAQSIFFVATAPCEGRVNLSPKGMDTFRCLSDHEVAYLDLTGSGNETSAHLEENGRLTLMFCSFSTDPLILRLYGQGKVVRPRSLEWSQYLSHFEQIPGTRQIISMQIEQVQTSCGFAVPLMEFQGERPKLADWAQKKGEEGLREYWQDKNQLSIDGLPTHIFE
jgi:Pyridoxamine 5'-phosphate oxidase